MFITQPTPSVSKQALRQVEALDLSPAVLAPALHDRRCLLLVARCGRLRDLSLSGRFRWLDDEALGWLLKYDESRSGGSGGASSESCRGSLTALDLSHCEQLCPRALRHLLGLPSLRMLSLRHCHAALDGVALERLPCLRELDAAWCRQLTSRMLLPVAPQLTRLVLHGCESVNDDLCSCLPAVEDLDLAFTGVGDAGLAALAAHSQRLARLTLASKEVPNLWACGPYTPTGLNRFRADRPEVDVRLVLC